MKSAILALGSALLGLASAAPPSRSEGRPQYKSYDGYKVFRVAVGDATDKVNGIISDLGLETWKGAAKAHSMADIVVPPTQLKAFQAKAKGLDIQTMHEDLGLSIMDEQTFSTYAAGSANITWFNSYHAYDDHLQFLRDLAASYPSNSAVVTSGSSLNGRPITGIHIWGSSGKGKKPAVVFHGSVHAREWITGMTVEYQAFTLLSNYSTNAEIKSFVDKYDFYIFPVVNPDGFVYSQTNDRMWRKNRQSTSGSTCVGRDINRNWPIQWSSSGGASTNPCAQDFKGSAQSDAPETTALSNFLKTTKANQGLKLFIDWHSYSQLFMYPYGYSCTATTPKANEYESLAAGTVAAIRAVYGTRFNYGPICSTIYKTTGSSVDWTQDVAGADYSFTFELRDTGSYGFVLPANQIVPSGNEMWPAVRYLLQNMR